jgi:hypothetical protein
VSVEGGKGTIETVYNAVKNEIPVLLVRGSGRATDLMSDLVLLKFGEQHAAHVRHPDFRQLNS